MKRAARGSQGESGVSIHGDRAASRLVHARMAVMFFFLLDGAVFGSWFARIPDVQKGIGLANDDLGIALLGAAAGALVMQPVAGWLISRWGSRRMTVAGACAQCAALMLPATASSLGALIISLAILGCATGILDVSMNVQGVTVEHAYRRFIMSTFHACYSVGGLLGAVTGGVAAGLGIAPVPHLWAVAGCSAAGIYVASRGLLPAMAPASSRRTASARPTRMLLCLAVVAFCVVLAEGAMGDWSAVYLRQDLALSAGMAAGGYAMFSLTMTVGRLAGGWLTASYGPVTMLRMGGVFVAAGLMTALAAEGPILALTGFAGVGIGLSCAFPVALSAAGRIHEGSPEGAIATINAAGYVGFLVGPLLIGFVSHTAGLAVALGLVSVVGVTMVALSGTVGPDRAGTKLSGRPVAMEGARP